MTVYLLEAYLARSNSGELAGIGNSLRLAASELPVRYLRTTYVPEDETCFHYLEAPSVSAVERVAERAHVSFDRILEARNVATGSDSKEER